MAPISARTIDGVAESPSYLRSSPAEVRAIAITSLRARPRVIPTYKPDASAPGPTTDASVVYISTNANPTTGAALTSTADGRRHYEIFRGNTTNAGDSWHDLKPKAGYGVGARWRSPVGPVQADVAYGVDVRKIRLHFRLGFNF